MVRGDLSGADCEHLCRTLELLTRFQQAHRLLIEGVFDPVKLGREGMGFVLRATGFADLEALRQAILVQTAQAAEIIARNLT
jgi:hypothetical protein